MSFLKYVFLFLFCISSANAGETEVLPDPNFNNDIQVHHPQKTWLELSKADKSARIDINSTSYAIHWSISDLMSTYYSFISNASLVNGERIKTSSSFGQLYQTNKDMINQFRPSDMTGETFNQVKKSIEFYQSGTSTFAINRSTGSNYKKAFGKISMTYDLWKDYFGDESPSTINNGVQARSGNAKKIKNYLESKLYLNEHGKEEDCDVVDNTFNSDMSFSCYNPTVGLATQGLEDQEIPMNGGFKISFKYRVIPPQEYQASRHLAQAGLSNYNTKVNMRLIFGNHRSEDNQPTYINQKGNVVKKTLDRIVATYPIFHIDNFCMDDDFYENSRYCKYQNDDGSYRKKSTVQKKPDKGTYQFMYKFGLDDVFGSAKTAENKVQQMIDGEWVLVEITSLYNFETLIKDAIDYCKEHYQEWDYPAAACDLESTDLADYHIRAVNFGGDLSGPFKGGFQLRDLSVKAIN